MERRVEQWQKQVDLFKNLEPYKEYRSRVDNEERLRLNLPMTPRITREKGVWSRKDPIVNVETYSKRAIAGILTQWKREIHAWNAENPSPKDEHMFIPEQFDFDDSKCESCGSRATYKCPCYRVGYCSKDCQATAWPTHREMCSFTFST